MRVCVVGHGPSMEGKGLGEEVDAHDVVIRMWDCHWQKLGDYGKKYDIGLYTLFDKDINELRRLCEKWPPAWWAYNLWEKGLGGKLPKNTDKAEVIDHSQWMARALELGGKGSHFGMDFTRGTLAALNAVEKFKPEELTLYGMDNIFYMALQELQCPLQSVNAYLDRSRKHKLRAGRIINPNFGDKKTDTHDYVAERTVLDELAQKHKVRLTWKPFEADTCQ